MIGVELVADRQTRQQMAAPHFAEIWEHCKDMGVLFGKGGLNGNVSLSELDLSSEGIHSLL
jgi:alanine-glyoxylate transaminase / (R)-3-amino-2-methylpropionate-pyruvate transaminase